MSRQDNYIMEYHRAFIYRNFPASHPPWRATSEYHDKYKSFKFRWLHAPEQLTLPQSCLFEVFSVDKNTFIFSHWEFFRFRNDSVPFCVFDMTLTF